MMKVANDFVHINEKNEIKTRLKHMSFPCFPHNLFLPLISTSFLSLLKLVSSLLRAATIPTTSGSFLRNSGTWARKEASTPVDPLNLCLLNLFPPALLLVSVALVKLCPPKLVWVAIAKAVVLTLVHVERAMQLLFASQEMPGGGWSHLFHVLMTT